MVKSDIKYYFYKKDCRWDRDFSEGDSVVHLPVTKQKVRPNRPSVYLCQLKSGTKMNIAHINYYISNHKLFDVFI